MFLARGLLLQIQIIKRRRQRNSKTSTLDQYSINLTLKAADAFIDPVVRRSSEMERVIRILGRRRKNNPILIGEPGVGKIAGAEGLVLPISNKDVTEGLEETSALMLDIGMLVARTIYRGEFEERLKRIIDELQRVEKILF